MPSRVEHERGPTKDHTRNERHQRNAEVGRNQRPRSKREKPSRQDDRKQPASVHDKEYLATSEQTQDGHPDSVVYATVDKHWKTRDKNGTKEKTNVVSERSNRHSRNLEQKHGTDIDSAGLKRKEDRTKPNKEPVHSSTRDVKRNGTYFAVFRQTDDAEHSSATADEAKASKSITRDSLNRDEIAFLKGDEINKIYQQSTTKEPPASPRRRASKTSSYQTEYLLIDSDRESNSSGKNGTSNPQEYQQRMQESRKALQRLRKSLSEGPTLEDRSTDLANEVPNTYLLVSSEASTIERRHAAAQMRSISQINPTIDSMQFHHKALANQSSNTSAGSSSSTISQKLLSLTEEDNKSVHRSPRTVKKMSAKRLSLKKANQKDNTEMSAMNGVKTKKIASPSVQYTLADVSPLLVRSRRNSRNNEKLNIGTLNYHHESEKYPSPAPTDSEILSIGDEYSSFKGSHSEASPSEASRLTSSKDSKSSSSNSSAAKDGRLVFEIDLDAPFVDQRRKRLEEDLVLYREHGIFIPVRPDNQRHLSTAGTRDLNKWIQTDGPPIRSPQCSSSSTQTGINPCTCVSKRLQMRPWNLPGLLYSNATQTPRTRLASRATQTEVKLPRTKGCQTPIRQYKDMTSQTKVPPKLAEFGVQAVVESSIIETQTADEDSEIWGKGTSVSLDRLIRSGALKRTQSIGHGVTGDIECVRERPSSFDVVSTESKENEEISPAENRKTGWATSGKIMTYSWSENGKFVKIFVSYSGVHLIPTGNIQITTNGISLNLTINEEQKPVAKESNEEKEGEDEPDKFKTKPKTLTSTLNLNRLRRPVSSLTYNVQRDMITIILRKQKRAEWTTLLYQP